MMGPGHAISSAAMWLGGCAAWTAYVAPVDPVAALGGAVVAAGAALLPDLDQEGSSAARSAGPVSMLPAMLIAAVTRHRRETHTLLAIVAVWAVMAALSVIGGTSGRTALIAVGWFCATGGAGVLAGVFTNYRRVRALGVSWKFLAVIAATVAAYRWPDGWSVAWVAVAVAVGYPVHLVGDALTTGGVPWLYPWTARRWALPLLGNTGSGREQALTVVLSVGVLVGVLAAV